MKPCMGRENWLCKIFNKTISLILQKTTNYKKAKVYFTEARKPVSKRKGKGKTFTILWSKQTAITEAQITMRSQFGR